MSILTLVDVKKSFLHLPPLLSLLHHLPTMMADATLCETWETFVQRKAVEIKYLSEKSPALLSWKITSPEPDVVSSSSTVNSTIFPSENTYNCTCSYVWWFSCSVQEMKLEKPGLLVSLYPVRVKFIRVSMPRKMAKDIQLEEVSCWAVNGIRIHWNKEILNCFEI